jgi:hypothetical protein
VKGIPPPASLSDSRADRQYTEHIFHRRKLNSLPACRRRLREEKVTIQSCSCDYRLKSLAAIGEQYEARDCADYSTLLAVGQAASARGVAPNCNPSPGKLNL